MKINNIRIIPYEIHRGVENMAVDHYFAGVNSDTPFVVFRFYGWNPCCISLGYHQKKSIINTEYTKEKNIEVVRRPTGGSAVFHCNELTYSVIISKSVINHQQLYTLIHTIIAEALNTLGFEVYLEDSVNHERTEICYNRTAKSEIKYDNKKLVGSAQKIYPKTILQHGSILFSNEQTGILDYLNYDVKKIEYYKKELMQRSVSLKDIAKRPVNKSLLINALVERIEFRFEDKVYYQYLTGDEKKAVKEFENLFSVK